MQRRTTDAPSALRGISHRVLAFEKDRRAGGLDPTAPYFGTDEIGKLPVGTRIQQDDLLACLRQYGSIDRTRCTGPDDDDVRFSNRPSRSSTFRLTATAMSTPLTGSCFSSESAQGPSIMGFEDERDNLYRGLVVSSNGRSKRTCELISSIGPRGTSFHG